MPKTNLDRMGQIPDSCYRLHEIRQYLHSKVQDARNFIYQAGHAVTGARIDSLLKLTSSVPVIVSNFPSILADMI